MPKPPKSEAIPKAEIGRRLRALRLQRGITQVELARLLGTQQTSISQVERGNRGLTVHQVVRLAKALRVPTDMLLGDGSSVATEPVIKDRRFLRRLKKIDKLSKRDKHSLLGTIDAFLSKVS